MNEKPSAARRFIAKIPLAGPAARWLWRLITAPGRLVRIERQGEQAQEHLTQIMAQSAHAIRRVDERLEQFESRVESQLLVLGTRATGPEELAAPLPAPNFAAEIRRIEEQSSRFEGRAGRALEDLGREAVQARETLARLEACLVRPTLDVIRELAAQVEPYQPLYGCPLGASEARRPCEDRARAIEQALDADPRGLRVLDLGASLGYFSFYFAERGSRVTGIDSHPVNVALARHVGAYNGLAVEFSAAEVSADFIRAVARGKFQVALVLSLLHHVIHKEGLAEAQDLLAELLERVPLVFVELATREEEVPYPWRESLSDDPLEVFARCRNAEIEKIGEFPTHLSGVPRPLYRVRRKSAVVNGVRYAVERATPFSYAGAATVGKMFLFGPEAFIKRVRPKEGGILAREILRQALREIANYENLRGRSARFPVLRDFSIGPEEVVIVFERLEAENLLDVLERGERPDARKVFDGVVAALADLRAHGLYHNDVRVWNVMVGAAGVTLIDLGHAEPEETDDTRAALLWLARDLDAGRVTRNVGWPLKEPPSRKVEDYAPAWRETARRLLAAPSFNEFLKGLPS